MPGFLCTFDPVVFDSQKLRDSTQYAEYSSAVQFQSQDVVCLVCHILRINNGTIYTKE
jgi:hypothetical protein